MSHFTFPVQTLRKIAAAKPQIMSETATHRPCQEEVREKGTNKLSILLKV